LARSRPALVRNVAAVGHALLALNMSFRRKRIAAVARRSRSRMRLLQMPDGEAGHVAAVHARNDKCARIRFRMPESLTSSAGGQNKLERPQVDRNPVDPTTGWTLRAAATDQFEPGVTIRHRRALPKTICTDPGRQGRQPRDTSRGERIGATFRSKAMAILCGSRLVV
jgi:hypothetical protein